VRVQAAESRAETELLLGALPRPRPSSARLSAGGDFESPQAAGQVFELAKHPRLAGLRPMLQDLGDPDWILREAVQPAIHATAAAGLRFDALIKPPQLPAIRKLLARYPDLPVVIDHGAKPPIAAGAIEDWAGHMRAIAADSNALCKLSGPGHRGGAGWTCETLRPYVDMLLKAFGPSRLMFGSDWPVLTENGDYPGWLSAAHALTAACPRTSGAQVFGGTAHISTGSTDADLRPPDPARRLGRRGPRRDASGCRARSRARSRWC
jgi:L-fuconolactonase